MCSKIFKNLNSVFRHLKECVMYSNMCKNGNRVLRQILRVCDVFQDV